jgi:hypothetical protein
MKNAHGRSVASVQSGSIIGSDVIMLQHMPPCKKRGTLFTRFLCAFYALFTNRPRNALFRPVTRVKGLKTRS